jgi:phosphoglycerate dehydrogenase-like enzyme
MSKIRVGVEALISDSLLHGFPSESEIVRIPAEPASPIEVDFWVAPIEASAARLQWPHLRGVRVVQSLYAGVDALLKIVPREVTLCDARGVHDTPIAEWAVGAILAMQKYFPFYLDLQRSRNWHGRNAAEQIYALRKDATLDEHSPTLVDELADSTVLIVGYGSIGEAIERRLAPFGVQILRVARGARPGVSPVADLDGLLGLADIVVCILPLTPETHHLLNARRIASMKPGALLVNAGRGATINTQALIDALEQKRIRAAVDVMEPEPLPDESPLWSAPNLLLTPHVAGDSAKFMARALNLAAAQATRFVLGQPLHNIVAGDY